jgi:hypothetical protein
MEVESFAVETAEVQIEWAGTPIDVANFFRMGCRR